MVRLTQVEVVLAAGIRQRPSHNLSADPPPVGREAVPGFVAPPDWHPLPADWAGIAEKKWEVAYPFIKEHYSPMINAAGAFRNSLCNIKDSKDDGSTEHKMRRLLFNTAVFFGVRLRFVIHGGSLILLSSTEEADKVHKSFNNILNNFEWAGDETPLRTSELQELFISKDKPQNPYFLSQFEKDLDNSASIKKSGEMLGNWCKNKGNLVNLDKALEEFIEIFKNSLDEMYTSLET